jgi:hypothetical protein
MLEKHKHSILLEKVLKGKKMKNRKLEGANEKSDKYIIEVNSHPEKYGWRADECFLSKTHTKYDA